MKTTLIETKKVLAPTQINLADYVINPYRGCGFGCVYCYAQKNKNIQKYGLGNFLGIKINAPQLLKEELKIKSPKRILLGSTAECFQEAEKKYQISRQILQILNTKKIASTILTKSSGIKDCLDIISQNKKNEIYFTLNLAPQEVINIFESNSSPLAYRLETIKKIIQKKIPLRIHLGPFIPYVSDLKAILNLIPQEISEINIELYHKKMGNFSEVIKKIGNNFGKKEKEKVIKIYSTKKQYHQYIVELKNEILKINSKNKIKFFYITPGFNQYYDSSANYQNPLKK